MSSPLTIVVTGSNRGIGQGIIHLLASTQHPQPLHIYATSRRGVDLKVQAKSPNEIRYAKLDVSDKSSITSLLKSVLDDNDKIDVLINNAGINNNGNETTESAEQTININYHGTKQMCQLFLEKGKMKSTPGARIVNVSSTASVLSNYPSATQSRFRSVMSVPDIDALAQEYIKSVQSNNQESAGFGAPPKSYQVSKALMNAFTVVLAKENEGVAINCCCPGWVDSDMGNQVGRPPKTLEEGARIPARLGIGQLGSKGDADGGLGKETERVSGRYFGNDGVTDRGWGKAREW
ncbi:carbonyl reductase 1 [Alternaria panax]|uniref:Carbonyl reductase 1 n=1 Tax=Alternaria panax TaxID=48097 RepID=A0AAD4FDA8_9PLEO|nr:carbonyl reductase 1 [Alternaria panax]